MTPEATIQQIRDIIIKLVQNSFVDHQHYPCMKRIGRLTQIGIEGAPELSVSLKDIEYERIFTELKSAGAYHLSLIDGAMVQMLYCFERRNLHSHRLCYFPSPNLPAYSDGPQYYEEDEVFADVFKGHVIRFPIRFDYASSKKEHVEIDHPKSHMSIGQYKGCRIPLDSPLTPLRFMRFLLRNFYNSAYERVNFDQNATLTRFPESITDREREIFHIRG